MDVKKMREEFEVWTKRNCVNPRFDRLQYATDTYADPVMETSWQAWQAALSTKTQAGEPVAWALHDKSGHRTGWTSELEYTRHAHKVVPLYVAQPAPRAQLMRVAEAVRDRCFNRWSHTRNGTMLADVDLATIVDAAIPVAAQTEPVNQPMLVALHESILTDDQLWEIRNHTAVNEVLDSDDSKTICVKLGRAVLRAAAEAAQARQRVISIADERAAFEKWLQEGIDGTDTARPSEDKVESYFAVWLGHAFSAVQSRAHQPQAVGAADSYDMQWWLVSVDQHGNPTLEDGAHRQRKGANEAFYLHNALGLSGGKNYAVAKVELFEPLADGSNANLQAIEDCTVAHAIASAPKPEGGEA